ncbi:hypothetical protein A2V68_00270 [candidate division Kazan bacterium RBG_13_50_9]|uniref:Type II secretion system protein GspE N-terminal domain-containing protein n=1 Tax=candidate division Kazan bacterium RBG_13_50_9 TaxID=1798535 RepID=A0A1F4NRZ4_UNCK3|nr:MAG: hypothetical protein A2V68_00270 [candidate division Kazan bacterium RBG_13_50_9]
MAQFDYDQIPNPSPGSAAAPASRGILENHLVFRRHPVNLLAPGFIALFMVVLVIIFAIFLSASGLVPLPDYLPYVFLFSGVLIILAITYFFMQWAFWYLDIWVVTEEKLIDSQLVALFSRRRSEIALRQVQDMRYHISGTLATLFRFGDIIIQSAAKEGLFRLIAISQPREAVNRIAALVAQASKLRLPQEEPRPSRPTTLLGEHLVRAGVISTSELANALSEQSLSGQRLGDMLIAKGLISKSDLVTALSGQYRIPEIDLSRYEIDSSVTKYISYEGAKKHNIIPVSRTNNGILVAISDPSGTKMGEIRDECEVPVDFVVADEDYIREAIHGHYLAESDESNLLAPSG